MHLFLYSSLIFGRLLLVVAFTRRAMHQTQPLYTGKQLHLRDIRGVRNAKVGSAESPEPFKDTRTLEPPPGWLCLLAVSGVPQSAFSSKGGLHNTVPSKPRTCSQVLEWMNNDTVAHGFSVCRSDNEEQKSRPSLRHGTWTGLPSCLAWTSLSGDRRGKSETLAICQALSLSYTQSHSL